MKQVAAIFVFAWMAVCANAQQPDSALVKQFEPVICKCLDSLHKKKALGEDALVTCMEIAFVSNTKGLVNETMRLFGDTTEQSGFKAGQLIGKRVSVTLVASCPMYVTLMDSMRFSGFKKLSRDTLLQALRKFDAVAENQRNADYYDQKGTLYFALRDYEKAAVQIDKALAQDPANIHAMLMKAWLKELKQQYAEALTLYQAVANASGDDSFEVMAEMMKNRLKP